MTPAQYSHTPEREGWAAASQSQSADKEFQNYSTGKGKDLFDGLRRETEEIEMNIALGEQEVLDREQMAFLMRQHDLALANLQAAHVLDLQKRKDALERIIVARAERKKAKKEARKTIRASKRRDQIIQQQQASADAVARIRDIISEKRAAFDATTQHMYSTHEKQRTNLLQSQDRRFANEKLLVDLETRHLKEEVRSTIMKKFQVRQNHLGHLNKRINDNLRELQLMDLRHSKERFELEMVCFEEIESKKNLHVNQVRLALLTSRHANELQAEKEAVISKKESAKELILQKQHVQELKKLAMDQRIELKQLKMKHESMYATLANRSINHALKNTSKQGSRTASHLGSALGSVLGSTMGSKSASRSNSHDSIHEPDGARKMTISKLSDAIVERDDNEDNAIESVDMAKMNATLVALQKRHFDELAALQTSIRKEIADIQLAFDVKFSDLEEASTSARIKLLEDQERELRDMRESQEKEIKIEEMMHDSEMKMLIERRILNSVLETVADGIINITTTGTIVRFNHAAEVMFGYKAAEVIGSNITVLMPERFAVNHDSYLSDYLNSGSGAEFPLYLSISELKEDGEHLFTGIARDLTEEVAIEEQHQKTQDTKKRELEALVDQLDVAKKQSDDLLSQMLPPSVSRQLLNGHRVAPQSYKSATVFFMDVVGFTTLSAQVSPIEVVSLLNSLYSIIDRVIEKYEVYKVETIGDSYMIVSGLPQENVHHAPEIATMALHLAYAIDKFVYRKKPDLKIRVRMGLNSGPVVAGVVGSKMPRYCLFGDTVNTASRMESNSMAGKIHMSASTASLLRKDGRFELTARGDIEVKGKGKMSTYFLESKLKFNPADETDETLMAAENSLSMVEGLDM
ncbi:hypothetical protein HDU91_007277 [Kappamyces sp. JEL0680]|nr:hypothetical protein HDU91_007277 [Kappamyces sp. JEL0680]